MTRLNTFTKMQLRHVFEFACPLPGGKHLQEPQCSWGFTVYDRAPPRGNLCRSLSSRLTLYMYKCKCRAHIVCVIYGVVTIWIGDR